MVKFRTLKKNSEVLAYLLVQHVMDFFKDKEVAVVGGGNAAVEEAMFLTKFASKVKLIHRRDSLRAEKMLQEKLKANKKIEIIWDSVVHEVLGSVEPKGVNGLKIKNVKDNKISELKLDGLFVAIGHDPATSLFKNQLKMDKEGYLITKPDSQKRTFQAYLQLETLKIKFLDRQ